MVSQVWKALNDHLTMSHEKSLHDALQEATFPLHRIIYSTILLSDRVVFTLLAPTRMPQERLK